MVAVDDDDDDTQPSDIFKKRNSLKKQWKVEWKIWSKRKATLTNYKKLNMLGRCISFFQAENNFVPKHFPYLYTEIEFYGLDVLF